MKNFALAITFGVGMSFLTLQSSAQTTTRSRSGKDALIGAGAGAVTGAVVSKKKGKGAIIGGAVGAAGGYAYGKHQDRRKGRRVVRKH